MPKNKDLKRLSRARMRKTGEAYTTARAHILRRKTTSPTTAAGPTTRGKAPRGYAALAGMSDEAVRAKTGCDWARWTRALDRAGCAAWPHREIAAHVRETYGLPAWWAQTVTVAYERIKGLREIGQRRGGSYEVTKTRTLPVPVAALYRAFRDPGVRRRWLADVTMTVRRAAAEKSMRITWEDGSTVEVVFTAKGDAKSAVSVQHGKLGTKADATRTKEYWSGRLATLAELLAPTAK